MTHFLFPRRNVLADARLLRMAPVPGEAPSAPDTPPPAETKGEKPASKPDPKATFHNAQVRIRIHGEKLNQLRSQLQPLQDIQARLQAGDTPKQGELDRHGLTDAAGDGLHDDVEAVVKNLQAQIDPHQREIDAAGTASEESLKSIAEKGPDGKLEAIILRVESVLKDPTAGLVQKGAALFRAFAELRGMAIPGMASFGQEGARPEAPAASPTANVDEKIAAIAKNDGDALSDARARKDYDKAFKGKTVDQIEPAIGTEITDYNKAYEEYTKETTAARDARAKELNDYVKTLNPEDPELQDKMKKKDTELFKKYTEPTYDKWQEFARKTYGVDGMIDAGKILGGKARIFMKAKQEFADQAMKEKAANDAKKTAPKEGEAPAGEPAATADAPNPGPKA